MWYGSIPVSLVKDNDALADGVKLLQRTGMVTVDLHKRYEYLPLSL
jgi:hypothetical protein